MSNEEEESQQLCSICLEEMDNNEEITTTNCNHNFHTTCFQRHKTICDHALKDCKCPNCRRVLSCQLINFRPLSGSDDGENEHLEGNDNEDDNEDSMPPLISEEEWREWAARQIPLISLDYHDVIIHLPNTP